MSTTLTLKQTVASVWQKFMEIVGHESIKGIGDGTLTGAVVELNSNLGNVKKFFQGSKSINVGGNAIDTIGLFSKNEVAHLLGVDPATLNTSQVVACVTNGDYAAKAFVVLGTYFHNDILQVKIDRKITYDVRLNYLFAYYG